MCQLASLRVGWEARQAARFGAVLKYSILSQYSILGHFGQVFSAIHASRQTTIDSTKITGMSDHDQDQGNYGLALQEAKPKLKLPPLFKVVLLNDEYTPR